MGKFLIRRFLWLIPVILVVSGITFILMHSAPGGPWDRDLSARQVDPSTQRMLDEYFGLDKPLWRQFVAYIIGDIDKESKFDCGIICGDLGPSYRQRGMTIQQILFMPPEGKNFLYSRFGYSMRLGFYAIIFAIVLGIPAGIISALKQNTLIDYVSLFFVTVGISIPNFVMAIFLIIIFASTLHWVNIVPRSWDQVNVWILPAVILGFNTMARTARLTRSSMLEVMRQDYIRTARSKGLAEGLVIFRHMLKNSMIPVVTMLGPSLAFLVTGSFIIETMFGFPGMGRAFVTAITQRDYSMIMGTTIIYAVLVAIANVSVDVIYVFLDPRIKLD
ncbi:MAG: ABC transporter permease [Chloroflexi bacterium HGW-Chloroflexi-10]|nr:MAG: ABC transporter permease [Chloroflexi bacterium HGW-Chloroflexi-10]